MVCGRASHGLLATPLPRADSESNGAILMRSLGTLAVARISWFAMLLSLAAGAALAQQPPAQGTQSGSAAAPQSEPQTKNQTPPAKPASKTHRFWDKENILLFAGVGAARGLDYASTLNIRSRGINEIFLTNGIVDNHPLFATIEAGSTAASIGVSYIFHCTGHHTLERWTSIVHIGVAVGGAIRNYSLPTPTTTTN
jgi:hypothetical protein